jgi:protein-S-isoprenylcysteine O-methyltransferase Ste14
MLSRTKLADLAASIPLLLLYGLGVAANAVAVASVAAAGTISLASGFSIAAQAATAGFFATQFGLVLLRRPPERFARGVAPVLAGLLGLGLPGLFVLLPRAAISPALSLASTLLILAGMSAAITVVAVLGRSFAILPQARGLVTRGPYRVIRHPLYLAEQVAAFGVMLQYAQPWAFGLAIASIAVQFPRMHYEEQVLLAAYPGYRDYAARTRRLLPGLY